MPETPDGAWILDCSSPPLYGEPKIVISFDQGNTPGDPHWLVGGRARPDDRDDLEGPAS